MPLSALPLELQDIESHFPDDDQYGTNWFGRLYRRYQKTTKTWFCFSFRCTEWWARWRKIPKVLFAIKGNGWWRFETTNGGAFKQGILQPTIFNWSATGMYLSRIQYYARWHFAIQWPLMVSCHVYPKAADVPHVDQPLPDTDGKLWFFYWNHFDADLVYWMIISIFLGRCWK